MSIVHTDKRSTFYETFAEDFDAKMNRYDLERRLEIIFDEMLTEDLTGRKLLDAGCGTGWFSARACQRGAVVTSLDVGDRLLAQVAKKCQSERVVGDVLALPFPDAHFDVVVCTEVIEHTVDAARAIAELIRVLRKGGTLVVTVPNRVWHFAVTLANALHLRPYEGYENWVSWPTLRREVERNHVIIDELRGFHLFPFVLAATNGLLRRLDRHGKWLGPVMVNLAVCGRKRG
jgi:2-polyprenyl-3-methyl-5-hydroxy-6-metoxy-1,4-benzoquinol methylase